MEKQMNLVEFYLYLGITVRVLLAVALIVWTVDGIYSITHKRKLLKSTNDLLKRMDILMTIPIKKARQFIHEQKEEE